MRTHRHHLTAVTVAVGLFTTPVLGEAPYMPPPADGDVRIMYYPGVDGKVASRLEEWTTEGQTIEGQQYWSYAPFGNLRLDPEGNVWVRWPAEDEARAFNAAFLQTISEHPLLQEAQQATAYKYVDPSSADLLYFEFNRPRRPEHFHPQDSGCFPYVVSSWLDDGIQDAEAIVFLDLLYAERVFDVTSFSIWPWSRQDWHEEEATFLKITCDGESWATYYSFRRGLGLYSVDQGSRGPWLIGARLDGVEWGDLTAVSPLSWASVKARFTPGGRRIGGPLARLPAW